jgi:hypothetical protein
LFKIWEDLMVLMKAVRLGVMRFLLKVMNLDLSKAKEMVPVWDELTVQMREEMKVLMKAVTMGVRGFEWR